jgi:hypothetical protein
VEPQETLNPDLVHAMRVRPAPDPRSEAGARPNGRLSVTVTVRWIPLVSTPYLVKVFVLTEHDGGTSTRLVYHGEIGADLWRVGQRWGELVARRWKQTVAAPLAQPPVDVSTSASRLMRCQWQRSVSGW